MNPTTLQQETLAYGQAVYNILLWLIPVAASLWALVKAQRSEQRASLTAQTQQANKEARDQQIKEISGHFNALHADNATAISTLVKTLLESPAETARRHPDPLALLNAFAAALHTTQDKTTQTIDKTAQALAPLAAAAPTLQMDRQALLAGIQAVADAKAPPAQAVPVAAAPDTSAAPDASDAAPPSDPPGLLAKVGAAITGLLPGGSPGGNGPDGAPPTTDDPPPAPLPATTTAPPTLAAAGASQE